MKFAVWGCHEDHHLSYGYGVYDTIEEACATVDLLNADVASTGEIYWYEEVDEDES